VRGAGCEAGVRAEAQRGGMANASRRIVGIVRKRLGGFPRCALARIFLKLAAVCAVTGSNREQAIDFGELSRVAD
jgi:hypothetical protein